MPREARLRSPASRREALDEAYYKLLSERGGYLLSPGNPLLPRQ